MGKLYIDGVSPSEIKEMPRHELKYWCQWSDARQEGKRRATEAALNGS